MLMTSSTYNQYFVADVQVEDEHTGTVPVYEKNNNFNLSIKSTSPLPATLISLTWEGGAPQILQECLGTFIHH